MAEIHTSDSKQTTDLILRVGRETRDGRGGCRRRVPRAAQNSERRLHAHRLSDLVACKTTTKQVENRAAVGIQRAGNGTHAVNKARYNK